MRIEVSTHRSPASHAQEVEAHAALSAPGEEAPESVRHGAARPSPAVRDALARLGSLPVVDPLALLARFGTDSGLAADGATAADGAEPLVAPREPASADRALEALSGLLLQASSSSYSSRPSSRLSQAAAARASRGASRTRSSTRPRRQPSAPRRGHGPLGPRDARVGRRPRAEMGAKAPQGGPRRRRCRGRRMHGWCGRRDRDRGDRARARCAGLREGRREARPRAFQGAVGGLRLPARGRRPLVGGGHRLGPRCGRGGARRRGCDPYGGRGRPHGAVGGRGGDGPPRRSARSRGGRLRTSSRFRAGGCGAGGSASRRRARRDRRARRRPPGRDGTRRAGRALRGRRGGRTQRNPRGDARRARRGRS